MNLWSWSSLASKVRIKLMLVEVADVDAAVPRAVQCRILFLLGKWATRERDLWRESRANPPVKATAFCRTTIAVDRVVAANIRIDRGRHFASSILLFLCQACIVVYAFGYGSAESHVRGAAQPTPDPGPALSRCDCNPDTCMCDCTSAAPRKERKSCRGVLPGRSFRQKCTKLLLL